MSFWLKRSNAVAAMSAVLKQLQASQSFLTQVRRLQNYNQLQQRQFVVLKSLVGKTLSVTAAEATRIYDAMDREIWTEEQLQELLSSVAALPPGDKAGKKLQDFSAFPNFLTQTQWTELEGCETTDQVAVKVLRYLAKLGLRHPSEPTLGNVCIFSYLVLSMEVPPAKTFQTELERFKPAARRLLLAHGEPSFHLQDLPEHAGALPLQVARAAYVTEGPVSGKVSLQQLLFAAGKKPLRKSSSQCVEKPNALGTLMDALVHVQQGSNLSSQSSSSGARRPLALQLPLAEPTVQPAKQPLAILDREPEAAKVAVGTAEMETAEEHLQRLKQVLEEPEVSLEQRGQKRASEAAAAGPASQTGKKPKKRPAAAAKQSAETEDEPKKRPAAAAQQASEAEEVLMRRPAAAAQQASEAEEVPMRRPAAAPKPRPEARDQLSEAEDKAEKERPVTAAKATAKGKAALRRPAAAGAAGPAGRQAVPGWTWEQRLAARPYGCGKCRYLVGCTPSCFA